MELPTTNCRDCKHHIDIVEVEHIGLCKCTIDDYYYSFGDFKCRNFEEYEEKDPHQRFQLF